MFWICERYSFDIFAIFDNYNEVKEFISNKKVYAYFLKIISLKYLIKLTIYMCIFCTTAKLIHVYLLRQRLMMPKLIGR